MRPESLRLLQQAARINPTVRIALLATDKQYGDAMVDVYEAALQPGRTGWSFADWDREVLSPLDRESRKLGDFMDSLTVRALIRAQEAAHANS
jgi:hypothetical protein